MALLLVSYLRLETLLSGKAQIFRLRWLGHRVVFDVKKRELSWWFFAWQILRRPLKSRQPKAKEEKKEKKPREQMSLKRLLEERQRIVELWRYFKRSLHIERLELNARLATPDPLWTGMLYGMVSSFIYPLEAAWPKARFRLQPDFAHELPSGTLNAVLGIRVFRIVVLGLKAFPIVRKLRQHSQGKEKVYGSSNPAQRTRRGHASSS
jgi:Protein of unknown function (DUF2953)